MEWGHQNISNTNLRDDELLTGAPAFLTQLVDYSRLRNRFHPYGKVLAEIQPLEGENVYPYVISHRLGATVAFDFLSCMVSLPLPSVGGSGVRTLLMIWIMEMNV